MKKGADYLKSTGMFYLIVCKIRTLISTPGTRFPRAVRPRRSLRLRGRRWTRFSKQESRTFRSNQLECFIEKNCRQTGVSSNLSIVWRIRMVSSKPR